MKAALALLSRPEFEALNLILTRTENKFRLVVAPKVADKADTRLGQPYQFTGTEAELLEQLDASLGEWAGAMTESADNLKQLKADLKAAEEAERAKLKKKSTSAASGKSTPKKTAAKKAAVKKATAPPVPVAKPATEDIDPLTA